MTDFETEASDALRELVGPTADFRPAQLEAIEARQNGSGPDHPMLLAQAKSD